MYFSLQLPLVNYSQWWPAQSKSITMPGVTLIRMLGSLPVMHCPDRRLYACLDFFLECSHYSFLVIVRIYEDCGTEYQNKYSIVMLCCKRFCQY